LELNVPGLKTSLGYPPGDDEVREEMDEIAQRGLDR